MLSLYGSSLFKILDNDEPILNEDLFGKLKQWRRMKSYKENIRPYIIFSDATLISICNRKPKNIQELMEIRGVGEKKIKAYGDEIIKLVNDYKTII